MQKALPIIVVIVVSIALWFAITSRNAPPKSTTAQNESHESQTSSDKLASGNSLSATSGNTSISGNTSSIANNGTVSSEEEAETSVDDRPATEVYKNADEALAAIKKAAADYDDVILDQFTQPGENCTWCASVYSSVKDLLFSPDTKADQKSYFAEILAVSGRVDNVKVLVDAIKNAKSPEESDTFSEALELAVGKDDVVKFLGDQLSDSSQPLKESVVAALTNQGSKLAVETLFNHTVAQGNADGYYSLGIGVGEMVPEEESWPFLQQMAQKKDAYSHLAVKSLLNVGLEGIKMVSDMFGNTDNPEFAEEVLNSAKDHVAFDDETIDYLKAQSDTTKSEVLKKWYKGLLSDYQQSEQEVTDTNAADTTGDGTDAQPFTPLTPGAPS